MQLGHTRTKSEEDSNFKEWSTDQVVQWLVENDFGEYQESFTKHQITGDLLPDLNYATLKDIGVLIVGDRARIMQAIKKLQPKSQPKVYSRTAKPTTSDQESSASNYSTPNTTPKMQRKPMVSFQSISRDSVTTVPLRDSSSTLSYQQPYRNTPFRSQRGSMKPLVIFPRTSSIKDKNSKSTQQDLSEAFDSVFGSASQNVSPSVAVAPSFSNPGSSLPTPTDPQSPNDSKLEKDIMNMKSVREKCVRVHGLENQSHIVKVIGIKDPYLIKKRILGKFGLEPSNDWQIFISLNENLIPIEDNELLKICETDNEHRGNLYLRNTSGNANSVGNAAEDARSIKKLHKFFGIDAGNSVSSSPNKRALVIDPRATIKGPQRTTSLFSPSPTLASKNNNKNLSAFFGERPPDELIVDQLEQFFPGIGVGKDSALSPDHSSIKNIVEANLKQKRSSKRGSALMLRRQTQNIEQLLKGTSLAKKQSKLITSVELEETDYEKIDTPTGDSATLNAVTPESEALPDSPKKPRIQSIPTPITFRWTPGRMIGQGAFGKVFHALNLDTGEFMAVKQVISGQEAQQKKQNESLEREIELLRDLHHDNVVRYIGFEVTEESFNVFLEYVSGGSLSSCLAKCGKFSEDIARSFTAQILCGLEYLHGRDIIHRDIKGANILITAEGGVKISDFGISKKNEYTAYHRMTRMSMQGSIYWMAPEVARGKGYSAKVDIWSCGCLVLEMLTGHVPWHRVQGNIIYLLGTGNSPPIPPELSEMATNFLKTTFEIDPEKRPMASDLLEHTFTDIDPSAVDFRVWSLEAIQRKLEEGTTSEEMTASEPEETSDSDFDEEDEDYEEYEQEMYEEDVSNAPMDQENVLEVNFSDMQLPMLDLDMDDDLYELTGLVPDEESESLEYLLNGSK